MLYYLLLILLAATNIAYAQFFGDRNSGLSVALTPPPPPSAQNGIPIPPPTFVPDTQIQTQQKQIPQQQQKIPAQPRFNNQFAHRAVVFNLEQEALLPPNLQNPFYKDPRVADVLAKSSWFTNGENLVNERDSEKIPREKIFYALKSAGFIRKRRSLPFYSLLPI